MSKPPLTLLQTLNNWLRRTPIAWLQLTYQKTRFLTASLGIASAITLMFIQLGLMGSLDESNTVLHKHLRGDLVMLNAQTEALILVRDFSRRRLYHLLGFEAVKDVQPIYYGQRNFQNLGLDSDIVGSTRAITVFGINPQQSPFEFPSLDAQLDKITAPNVVLFDRKSRSEYGTIAEDFEAGRAIAVELDGEQMTIGGIIDFSGTSFGSTGNLVTSDVNFLHFFPEKDPEQIALGLITLHPGTDPNQVAQTLQNQLPIDVKVLTIEQFVEQEQYYWRETTVIGFIFQMGSAVGFLIGMYIVYQILYADTTEHIPDYAILRAKGYQSRYFWTVLIQEAVILSVSSYIPGYLFSLTLYRIVVLGTNLPISMTRSRALLVLVLTFLMCLLAGFLVVRKLKDSDPADLF
ncbi:MAG: ABC transporter permease DevC [Spirulinaceae cyanobacterium]